MPRQRGLREAAAPFLADLFEATHETVHLAVPDGIEVVYVQKLDEPQVARGPVPGGRPDAGPLHRRRQGDAGVRPAGAAGRGARGRPARRAPRTVIAPGLLSQELARIRERGVAMEHEESTVGITCVAAPVLDADGRRVAAVSITGWVNRLDPARFAPAVRTAALGISRYCASATPPSVNLRSKNLPLTIRRGDDAVPIRRGIGLLTGGAYRISRHRHAAASADTPKPGL